VVGFKYLQKVYPRAKPEDLLFKEEHPELLKKLLRSCNLREDVVSGMTRDAKSLRSTGMSLRLQQDNDPSYTDIAEWARTSPQQIFDFYDQVDPDWRMRRMVGGDEDLTEREKKSREDRKKLRKQIAKAEMEDNDDVYGGDEDDEVNYLPQTDNNLGPTPEIDAEPEQQLSTKSRPALKVVRGGKKR
jgi:hypothetical protein